MSKLDIVALLEWAERQKTFPKQKLGRKNGRAKIIIPENFDPIEYVRAEKEKVARWEKYLKDEEKLNKKEDKKPEYKGPSLRGIEWFVIGLLSYPFMGPLWKYLAGVQ